MTAIPLFHALAGSYESLTPDMNRAGRLAAEIVAGLLADWERIKRFQNEFGPTNWNDPATSILLEKSIHGMFESWAAEAEQILVRLHRRVKEGNIVPGMDELEDAYGFAQARLKFDPDDLARAIEQSRTGPFTPVTELRNELRARVRA